MQGWRMSDSATPPGWGFRDGRPLLALAPMQAVTDLAFWRVLARRGGPDVYLTEYFRVHADSRPEPWILRSIDENPTGRPVVAQLIGRDIPALCRTAADLEAHAVAGIDLNLGCPAPVVCRKDAGGGLLRRPREAGRIIAALREAVTGRLSVKTRLGFRSDDEFPGLLEEFSRQPIDVLSVHGRTVSERYATPVHLGRLREAVARMSCPVVANGNIVDVATGLGMLAGTGAAGLMIGRGAIRNPWIFRQLRDAFDRRPRWRPCRRDLLDYVGELFDETAREARRYDPLKHVQRMKKLMVFIAQGIGGEFEFRLRRVTTPGGFHGLCREFLDRGDLLPDRPPERSRLFCGFDALLGPDRGGRAAGAHPGPGSWR
jgi:tRNA-dihydrouridine synthase C